MLGFDSKNIILNFFLNFSFQNHIFIHFFNENEGAGERNHSEFSRTIPGAPERLPFARIQ